MIEPKEDLRSMRVTQRRRTIDWLVFSYEVSFSLVERFPEGICVRIVAYFPHNGDSVIGNEYCQKAVASGLASALEMAKSRFS